MVVVVGTRSIMEVGILGWMRVERKEVLWVHVTVLMKVVMVAATVMVAPDFGATTALEWASMLELTMQQGPD